MTEIEKLRDEILAGCPTCPWKHRKSRTVPSTGPVDSPVAFVGRNPGKTEDQTGVLFSGKSGDAFDHFLSDSRIARDKVYLTNTSKCFGGLGDPCPDNNVFDACEEFLTRELALVRPRLIVPLGNDAYRRLTGDVDSITRIQGKPQTFRHRKGTVYFPVTHPSYWLRREGYYEAIIRTTVLPVFAELIDYLGFRDRVGLSEVPGSVPVLR